MRANARGVFTSSLLALAVVLAWCGWREVAPENGIVHTQAPLIKGKTGNGLGILAYIDAQLAPDAYAMYGNPFAYARAEPRGTRGIRGTTGTGEQPDPTKPDVVVRIVAQADPEQTLEAVPDEDPTPPERGLVRAEPGTEPRTAKRETIHLTYRGVFKRSDGRVMALIEDSKTKGSSFYLTGNELYGIALVDASTEHVTIELEDGTSGALELGVPTAFEGGRYAD